MRGITLFARTAQRHGRSKKSRVKENEKMKRMDLGSDCPFCEGRGQAYGGVCVCRAPKEDEMIEKECVPGTDIPKPTVRLVGEDGNAFAIMGRVQRVLRKSNVPSEVLEKYLEESMSGDYDNLLRVAFRYVDAE